MGRVARERRRPAPGPEDLVGGDHHRVRQVQRRLGGVGRDEHPPAASGHVGVRQAGGFGSEHEGGDVAGAQRRHLGRHLPHVEDRRLHRPPPRKRGDVPGPGHGRSEIGSHSRLLEHVVRAPGRAPALHRSPVAGLHDHEAVQAGVSHRPRRRPDVRRRLGADEDDLDPGQAKRFPPGAGE